MLKFSYLSLDPGGYIETLYANKGSMLGGIGPYGCDLAGSPIVCGFAYSLSCRNAGVSWYDRGLS
jgi:hypothetical protein